MKKTLFALSLLVLCAGLASLASADTLTLVSNPYGQPGPYQLKVNSNLEWLVCASDNNKNSIGESWYVNTFNLDNVTSNGTFSSPTKDDWNEAAWYADELLLHPGTSDLQNDIWTVLAIGGPGPGFDSYWKGLWDNQYSQTYVTKDTFYIPKPGDAWKIPGEEYPYGVPQPFIGTPEPGSLTLLAFGLLGTLKLRNRVKQSS
ncbi:MAG: PEP-CTERM sorting domain-containing protein [Terriglobales bacterium]